MAMATYRKLQVFNTTTDFKAAVKIVQVPLTEPEPNQIRVKQLYAGVNATDINITAARYFTDGKIPFDIGFESVGIVDAIGSSIPAGQFKIGQAVLVFDLKTAQGFSEYTYKTPDALFPIPEAHPKYLVALINGLTASIALDKSGHIKAGDKVLITAAAGGTGQIAVQWAKQRGATVIGMTSSASKAAFLKSLGADVIINYRESNLDEELTRQFPDGVDIVWETIGGQMFKTLFNHLAIKGRIVIIGTIASYKDGGYIDTPIEGLNPKLLFGSKSVNGFYIFHSDYIPEYLPKVVDAIASGAIKAEVDLGEKSGSEGRFVGLEGVYRAQDWLHSGANVGKVVVQIQ